MEDIAVIEHGDTVSKEVVDISIMPSTKKASMD